MRCCVTERPGTLTLLEKTGTAESAEPQRREKALRRQGGAGAGDPARSSLRTAYVTPRSRRCDGRVKLCLSVFGGHTSGPPPAANSCALSVSPAAGAHAQRARTAETLRVESNHKTAGSISVLQRRLASTEERAGHVDESKAPVLTRVHAMRVASAPSRGEPHLSAVHGFSPCCGENRGSKVSN